MPKMVMATDLGQDSGAWPPCAMVVSLQGKGISYAVAGAGVGRGRVATGTGNSLQMTVLVLTRSQRGHPSTRDGPRREGAMLL